jgi:hypothetical protein
MANSPNAASEPMQLETHYTGYDIASPLSTSSSDNSPSTLSPNFNTRIKSFLLPNQFGNYTYAIQYIKEYDILVIGDQRGNLYICSLIDGEVEVLQTVKVNRDIASLTYLSELGILVIGCKHYMMYFSLPQRQKIYFTRHDQVYVEDYMHLDSVTAIIGNVNNYVTANNWVKRRAVFRLSSSHKFTVKKLLPKRNLMVFGTVEGYILIYHSLSRMLLNEVRVVWAQGLASYLNILCPDSSEEHILIGGCDGKIRKWALDQEANMEVIGEECNAKGSWLSGTLLFEESDTFLSLQLDKYVCVGSYSKMKVKSQMKIPNPKAGFLQGQVKEPKGNALVYIKEKNMIVGGDYHRGTVFTIPGDDIKFL